MLRAFVDLSGPNWSQLTYLKRVTLNEVPWVRGAVVFDAHGGRRRATRRPDGRNIRGDDRAGLRALPHSVLPGSPSQARQGEGNSGALTSAIEIGQTITTLKWGDRALCSFDRNPMTGVNHFGAEAPEADRDRDVEPSSISVTARCCTRSDNYSCRSLRGAVQPDSDEVTLRTVIELTGRHFNISVLAIITWDRDICRVADIWNRLADAGSCTPDDAFALVIPEL